MPYEIRKRGNSYVVRKKDGKVVAGNKTKLSKSEAMETLRARYAVESGAKMRNV